MSSLGNDLATLREKQGLSLNELQKQTRIALPILKSIEDDSIFSRFEETAYIRNYIRSYARTLGVEESKIIKALDQVQHGEYQGLLQDEDADQPDSDDTREVSSDSSEAEPLTPPPNDAKNESRGYSTEDFSAYNWKNIPRRGGSSKSVFSNKKGWLIALFLIVCIAGGFLFYRYDEAGWFSSDPGQTGQAGRPSPPPPSDSLRQALARGESAQPVNKTGKNDGSMPDTLSVSIIAYGKLEPIHVFSDVTGKSNPYWIQSRDTVSFDFVNNLRIRAAKQYHQFQLVVNGKIIQNFYQKYFNPKTGSIELNRSKLKSYFR